MATIQCPNCQSRIPKPLNPAAIVLGILGVFAVGGTMLIIVCLAAVAAVGTSASQEFQSVSDSINAGPANEVSFVLPESLSTETLPAETNID